MRRCAEHASTCKLKSGVSWSYAASIGNKLPRPVSPMCILHVSGVEGKQDEEYDEQPVKYKHE